MAKGRWFESQVERGHVWCNVPVTSARASSNFAKQANLAPVLDFLLPCSRHQKRQQAKAVPLAATHTLSTTCL